MSRSAKWDALVQWVKDSFGPPPTPDHDDSPFQYVEKKTQELKLGDYVVAYGGYIQRIGAVEYDGSRLVVTKLGHSPEREWQAFEDDEFTIRTLKEGK
ncbi:hypothetical protein glasur_15 [Escherichia phage glasur]|uniref:Uncharacterized protein n=1 Tax=Escherichia phage glasur TaxID=2696400 RepID=A0A6B9WS91_9CAUD|nr:hypothetical protein glasur_15 [Escherichia phage glasur]